MGQSRQLSAATAISVLIGRRAPSARAAHYQHFLPRHNYFEIGSRQVDDGFDRLLLYVVSIERNALETLQVVQSHGPGSVRDFWA